MPLTFDENLSSIPLYPKADIYGSHDGIIILSSNEIPYPPSERVFKAIVDSLFSIHRYPEGEDRLKRLLSKRFSLEPENFILGNGSNELIEISLKGLRHKEKKEIIVPYPSFPFYTIAAQIEGYEVKRSSLKEMKIDFSSILSLVNEKTRIIFLNNPHNPTGTIFEEKEFLSFLKDLPEDILVVVDEAYAEFVENRRFPSLNSYIHSYPVLVLRTFSKAFGLAGLRVGYGIGEKGIISFLEKMKQPFNINYIAIKSACAALEDEDHLIEVISAIKKGRDFLSKAFEELGIDFVRSEANYILIRLGDDAERVYRELIKRNIFVRWMAGYGLKEYLRVTVGKMRENEIFIETLKEIMK